MDLHTSGISIPYIYFFNPPDIDLEVRYLVETNSPDFLGNTER